ncbi:MAG: PIN domain-containing protein [Phycisphaerae bacterium]
MNILVDSSIWSLVLRREGVDPQAPGVKALYACMGRGDQIHLIGSILQEVLSGIKSADQFYKVRDGLAILPLIDLTRDTYIDAARLFNACQRMGIQAGQTDCLIAAAAVENGYPLLTMDDDFLHIARCCELRLLPVHENPKDGSRDIPN